MSKEEEENLMVYLNAAELGYDQVHLLNPYIEKQLEFRTKEAIDLLCSVDAQHGIFFFLFL